MLHASFATHFDILRRFLFAKTPEPHTSFILLSSAYFFSFLLHQFARCLPRCSEYGIVWISKCHRDYILFNGIFILFHFFHLTDYFYFPYVFFGYILFQFKFFSFWFYFLSHYQIYWLQSRIVNCNFCIHKFLLFKLFNLYFFHNFVLFSNIF